MHDCRVCNGNMCYTECLLEKMDILLSSYRRALCALAVTLFPAVPEKEV